MTSTNTPPPAEPVPVTVPVGTKEADPTLGILSHVVAVGVGAVAGWVSAHIPGVTLSDTTQLELTSAVIGGVTTLVHYLQARSSAKKQGA